MTISDGDILKYTTDMYSGAVFKPWLQAHDKVSIDSLRDKCSDWLRTNRSTFLKPSSKIMTKIVYTLLTRFIGTEYYWKFSDGARNGETQHSLLRAMTAVAPTPAPMPWDGGVPPSAPPVPMTAIKPGAIIASNPCNEMTIGRSHMSSLDYATSYYTTTPTHKGNTMNRVFENRAFINNREASTMSDEELLSTIRTCKADIELLEDTDVVSKFTLKQIAYYKKAIKRIINVLDKRV